MSSAPTVPLAVLALYHAGQGGTEFERETRRLIQTQHEERSKITRMPVPVDQEKCAGCGTVLSQSPEGQDRLPCPTCGSTVRAIEVSVTDNVECHDSLAFKQKRPGYKKPLAEGISGDQFFHKQSRWVKKERLIDRQAKRYREVVTDPVTGEIIHHCDEPLDKHTGHGSAKRRPSRKT